MKILVIGASGLVGSHVRAEALARGHEVLGTYRKFPTPNLVHLDLANESQARALLESFRPEWVVHAAGWTWVDGCEKDPDRAMRENCEQPVMVARLCKEIGIRMVYFSTHYVFDGSRGPYSESIIRIQLMYTEFQNRMPKKKSWLVCHLVLWSAGHLCMGNRASAKKLRLSSSRCVSKWT